MKTFADLKRTIKPGMKLRVIQHDYRPELTGTVRTVTDVQGNGYFYLTEGDPRRAWSHYAKASCYSFPAPDTYTQDEGANPSNGKRFSWTIKIEEGAQS